MSGDKIKICEVCHRNKAIDQFDLDDDGEFDTWLCAECLGAIEEELEEEWRIENESLL